MIERTITVTIDDDSCHAEIQNPEYPESFEITVYPSPGGGWALGDSGDADNQYFSTFDEARDAFARAVTVQLGLELENEAVLVD